MTAGIWNFQIEQGATFQRVITWEDGDGPVDPSGYAVSMQIRDVGDEILVELTSDPEGGIDFDPEARTMTITIDADDTAMLDFKRGNYDLRFVHPGGTVIRLLKGVANVDEAVTR